MRLTVRLSDDDIDVIDRYASDHAVTSRSEVVRRAVALLRDAELSDGYAAAWYEWSGADDWQCADADGLT